jgi:hypothetical protein
MASLPVEVLFGVYLGVLTGIVPALVSWGLGFTFKYFTGVTIPGLGVVVLAVAIAGVSGGLLALNDPTITGSENRVRLTVALVVVLMLSLYAHNRGDALGASLPRRLTLRRLTERTLSRDVVELAGRRGRVTVSVVGDVGDVEGYPEMPEALRAEIRESTWAFPADLPLSELENRVADRLRTAFDLADVSVTLDERARATVAAAPPVGALSKRVPAGDRAVAVDALVPTGLARGDEVTVVADGERVSGTVLGATAGDDPSPPAPAETGDESDDDAPATAAPRAATAAGGEGQGALAVDRSDAEGLLGVGRVERLTVRSRGVRREFELVSMLRRAGLRFRRLTARADGALDGATLGEAAVHERHGVVVLAVRHDQRWRLAPRGDQSVAAGDELFVVGAPDRLASFQEVAA